MKDAADDTRGRKLYRQKADTLANAQSNVASRSVRLDYPKCPPRCIKARSIPGFLFCDRCPDRYGPKVKAEIGIRRLPEGCCRYCDEHCLDSMMPPHTPSARCESGKRPHCTCDICF